MKPLVHIIVGISLVLSGLPPAFGITLFNRGKSQAVNRWPYSFGDRYIYDNGGSSWNYDRFNENYRKYRCNNGHRHLRFQDVHKRSTFEKLDRLIKKFTKNSSRHNEPSHSKKRLHCDHFNRLYEADLPEY